jgi:hypothetical protein
MAYQIKVTLRGIDPLVWRRLRVPGTITFEQLHHVIQASFGWLNYHLYNFQLGSTVFAQGDSVYTDEDLYGAGSKRFDPDANLIGAFLSKGDELVYEYDFGDGWIHDIVVEKQLKELKKYATPLCLGGARHRPPEDVGGLGGYESFLESIRDPKDPEREDNLRWAQKDTGGRLFDPEYFYIDEVNSRLEHVLTDTPEFARSLLAEGQGLVGVLEMGWVGPLVKTGDQVFDWDRLGRLVSMLDDGVPIAIRVVAPARHR